MPAPPILEIYVVWHPSDELGRSAADALVRHFHGPAYAGLAGGAVEVYLRSAAWNGDDGPPRPLPFMSALPGELSAAQITAIIPVLGRGLARAVRDDERWREYVESIFAPDPDRAGLPTHGVATYPLRVPGADFSGSLLDELTSGPQALPTEAAGSDATLAREVAQAIAQRLARESTGRDLEERITVFISHTKHPSSGPGSPAGLVQLVRDVLRDTRLGDFFDAHDIQVGDDWAADLDRNASHCALLMVRTDAYASREWTQREVLAAKLNGVPIVSLYTVREEEQRGSFLMDHVPVIACQPGAERAGVERALNRLVDEALKRALWSSQQIYLARDGFDWLPVHAPEPVTLAAWLKRHRVQDDPHLFIMHPDPPLGPRERAVVLELCELAGLVGKMDILTPRTFAARGGEVESQ